jgi:hypothetical protein
MLASIPDGQREGGGGNVLRCEEKPVPMEFEVEQIKGEF